MAFAYVPTWRRTWHRRQTWRECKEPSESHRSQKAIHKRRRRRRRRENLQLTVSWTVASFLSLMSMARFQATQRYSAPSSSFDGRTTSVDMVATSFEPPEDLTTAPSSGLASPRLYHLRTGSGLPPVLEHTNSLGCPSTATGLTGLICGVFGWTKTIRSTDWACNSMPVPCSLRRHSKRPLSRS